ncbi:MAG TPA: hypothetical protein VGF10_09325 [Gaiella sp.]
MPDADASRSHRRLELVATFLLACATVGTAWSAYQSREWTGEQSQGYSRATKNRIAVNRVSAIASRQVQIDVATFVQWVDARERGNTRLADFYRQRFRDEFEPAFAAWLATDPLTSPSAPRTPFAMPQYRLAANAEADRLEAAAAVDSDTAKDANERANGYMLGVVMFASALFFAGLSTKLESPGARKAVLGLGCVLFVGTVVYLATLPIQLA